MFLAKLSTVWISLTILLYCQDRGIVDKPLELIIIQKIMIICKGDTYKNYDDAEIF
ncbi:MAG: hypothetical protein ABI045_01495 [Flavobacteriales bacterium]